MYKLNKRKEIYDILIEKFNESGEIYIAVSFITEYGFNEIKKEIRNFEDKKVNIIATTDEYITSKKFLDDMFHFKNVEIKLLNKSGDEDDEEEDERAFRSSFLIFKKKNYNKCLINGSFNISYKSLMNNYISANISYNYDDIEEAENAFDFLWNEAEVLTEDFLANYNDNEIEKIEDEVTNFEITEDEAQVFKKFDRFKDFHFEHLNPIIVERELFEIKNTEEVEKNLIEEAYNILIRKGNLRKYFKEQLNKIKDDYDVEGLYLLELLTKELDLDFSLILNNMRINNKFRRGKKSWISLFFSELLGSEKFDWVKLNADEHSILELFSWMPFTVSTPSEKRLILNLINGQEIEISKKWISYFLSKNIFTGRKSQAVDDERMIKFFSTDKEMNILKFDLPENRSEAFEFLLEEIKQHLVKNLNQDDFMISGKWYSKHDIRFMAKHIGISRKIFSEFAENEEQDIRKWFVTSSTLFSKLGKKQYENRVLNEKTFLIREVKNLKNDRDRLVDESIKYLFLGTDKFNQRVNGIRKEMFKYLGAPKDVFPMEEKANYFKVVVDDSLNNDEHLYLHGIIFNKD